MSYAFLAHYLLCVDFFCFVFCFFCLSIIDATSLCACGIFSRRVDDEDDEIVVLDQDVQRLVIVTRVSPLNYKIVYIKNVVLYINQ